MILNSMDDDLRASRGIRAALDEAEIRASFCSHPPVTSRLGPGRLVRVCAGAFEGVEGAILEGRENCRSIVALKLSQSGVYLEIDDALLEAID